MTSHDFLNKKQKLFFFFLFKLQGHYVEFEKNLKIRIVIFSLLMK